MKVTSTKNSGTQGSETARAELKRGENAQKTGGGSAGAGRVGRDFASVLRDVAHPGGEAEGHGSGSAEQGSETAFTSPLPETDTRRRREAGGEERHDFVLDPRGGVVVNAAPLIEVVEARAILHSTDLEKIVAAIHTQMVGGGRREITLELSRSVLAGLRVKLSADTGGRISAEFIAGDDKIRALLDGRSQELADMLRSRGVNLSSLKTTADAGSFNHGGAGSGGSYPPDTEISEALAPAQSSDTQAEETQAQDVELTGHVTPTTKYRA
jgi:hypothetical protein